MTIADHQNELDELFKDLFGDEEPPRREHSSDGNLEASQVIALCRVAKNGSKFARLFDHGDISAYPSQSEADQALCYIIAFYTPEFEIIDAVFRQSKLYRSKWERQDYREGTIENAVRGIAERYTPPKNGQKPAGDSGNANEHSDQDSGQDTASVPDSPPEGWLEPENRGQAVLSDLGTVEYIEDLVRPGRILVWAAEEGSGKSYSVTGELGIRLAVAGGAFADTWEILRTGPVVYLSEMHGDDEYLREEQILEALAHTRYDLDGRYFRLPIYAAAKGQPPLVIPEWCTWMTTWLMEHKALALIVDTATAATNVDPWGRNIQQVFLCLRQMQMQYPALAIILVVHLKKPQGHGERRLSDVLGEWGRWCDVVVLQENDGNNLMRSKLTVRKRVRLERRIVATKQNGLLADPQEIKSAGAKVSTDKGMEVIKASPGLTVRDFAKALGVAPTTASSYAKNYAKQGLIEIREGEKSAKLLFPTE